jgi:hypothetical protein
MYSPSKKNMKWWNIHSNAIIFSVYIGKHRINSQCALFCLNMVKKVSVTFYHQQI